MCSSDLAETDAEVCIPAFMDPADARRCVLQDMAVARSHHVRWLIVDTLLFIVSGVLAILPGPNLVAYYFAFRCVGHLQSWRGARQGMDVVRWTWRIKLSLHLQLDLMSELRERAEEEAIQVFARNLKDLLLAAPAGSRATISASAMSSGPMYRSVSTK